MVTRKAAGPLLLGAILALGACGSGGGATVATAGTPSAGSNSNAPSDDPATRERQLITCMRQQGLDMMDPVPGDPPGSVVRHELDDKGQGSNPKFQAALDTCHQFLSGTHASAGPPGADEMNQRRQFAQCMREHDLPDFPDPDPQTGELLYGFSGSGKSQSVFHPHNGLFLVDPTQKVKAAVSTCEHELPPDPSPSPAK
jgi:hypothetical protein